MCPIVMWAYGGRAHNWPESHTRVRVSGTHVGVSNTRVRVFSTHVGVSNTRALERAVAGGRGVPA